MAKEYALTTVDNPFDPFDQFDSWILFDKEKEYNCCELLGRLANVSEAMSEEESNQEIERAIDEIIKYDFRNVFKKVIKET